LFTEKETVMPVTLEEILNEMPAERRARIDQLAEEMRAEINLREMRRLRKLTQARLSKKLKIGQEGVSRIEKRTDLYLSTLRGYVEGVGGKLSLLVEFPDRPPVILAGLGEKAGEAKGGKKTKKKTGATAKSNSGSHHAA
jgi:DNA-binding XRE family transcriptional regulator